ncbi:hypothetical protein LQ327_02830 [Actinomycetospora endophytica]|uniref:Uncharacterized protein n=1 Tax=Actinomycetospora endophytica TaxID=2291215 RepID=A0ABS8P260_9PSEU|nr:hypothetical protein [Actinomycetospora endophytica]MCD2192331.1 hypothetical protein [Actinomycetospora endophytica]
MRRTAGEERNDPGLADDVLGMGDHARHHLPAQVGPDAAGRLEAAARARHLVAALVPVQRCTPTDLPRPR